MITFIAISVVICCALVIAFGLVLTSILDDIRDDIKGIKGYVDEINRELPYNQWFVNAYRNLNKKLDDVNDHLTTEIACLATKNNEDIKRLKGNYIVGDILRFDGTRWRVFSKDALDDGRTRWKLFGENGEEYRIYTDTIPEDLEFLGHRDLSFD